MNYILIEELNNMSTLLQEIEALIKTTQESPNLMSVWQKDYNIIPGFSSGNLGNVAPYQEIQEPDPKLNPDSKHTAPECADLLKSNPNKYARHGDYTSIGTSLSRGI
jgi:hypothetical protein